MENKDKYLAYVKCIYIYMPICLLLYLLGVCDALDGYNIFVIPVACVIAGSSLVISLFLADKAKYYGIEMKPGLKILIVSMLLIFLVILFTLGYYLDERCSENLRRMLEIK